MIKEAMQKRLMLLEFERDAPAFADLGLQFRDQGVKLGRSGLDLALQLLVQVLQGPLGVAAGLQFGKELPVGLRQAGEQGLAFTPGAPLRASLHRIYT